MAAVTSARSNENFESDRSGSISASELVARLSTQTTSHSSSSSRRQMCEPKKPAPPVTTARPGRRLAEVRGTAEALALAEATRSAPADAAGDEDHVAHPTGVPD